MINSIYISKTQIENALKTVPTQGKRLLEPLKSFATEHNISFNILEDKEVSNAPEIHVHEADLWGCLEGTAEFVCGGEMVGSYFQKNSDGTENKNEITGKEIRDGKKLFLQPGDWLYIPPGEPHKHGSSRVARMIIIKIPKS
ncbi:MAG: hypothetical protein HYT93_01280 [Parcubacteria group bacterium]|nr:hypothetical protein [Parcubacteria group bacterium]